MIKKFLSLLFSFLFLLALPPSTLAQQEFATSYTVAYTVSDSGTTHTKFDITLTNKLSNIYATEFSLSIGSTKLENISAKNSSGSLPLKVASGEKTTNLNLTFPDKVLGKDKSQIFTIEFDSLDFANKLGSVWEISIPKLARSEDLSSYQLTLSIPQAFGRPASITPKPISQTAQGTNTVYRFDPADLEISGISATFGESQHFDFSLTYELANSRVYPVKTEIALPPDTAWQQILYQKLDPAPDSVSTDADGNWLASYNLSPRQNLIVTATGSASLFLKPRSDFPQTPLENPGAYLTAQKYWETDNPNLNKLALDLKTPQAIYQYVVDNLIYDYGRLSNSTTRFGAANALDKPDSAICMEFTDLFIALARAAGIPARAINGFAYTTNPALKPLSLKQDVLHAWPEYYDSSRSLWVPVDPTWGNTTGGVDYFNQLDLNHFAFAILGRDSTYPVPAGAYKTAASQEKSIAVDFGRPLKPQPKLFLDIKLPQQAIAGVDLTGSIVVANVGNAALYDQVVTLTSQHFTPEKNQWLVASLPPFAKITIPISLPATGFAQSFSDQVSVKVDGTSQTHQIDLVPAFSFIFRNPKFLFGLAGLFSAILALIGLKRFVLK